MDKTWKYFQTLSLLVIRAIQPYFSPVAILTSTLQALLDSFIHPSFYHHCKVHGSGTVLYVSQEQHQLLVRHDINHQSEMT